MQFVQNVFHGITEVGDFIDALSEGLDPKYRIKGTLDQKIANLWTNFDHIKWGTAIEAVIKNEIVDRAVGRMLAKTKQGFTQANATGYGTGAGGRVHMSGRAIF